MKNSLLLIALLATTCTFAATPKKDLGKFTYKIACITCHAPDRSKALDAPAAFDKNAWKLRIDNAKIAAIKEPKKFKNAYAYLVYQVKIGKGLMHHGGFCKEADVPNKDCSDDAYIAAIKYMAGIKN